jgi:hypothetical protein
VSQNIQDELFRITSDDAIIDMEEDITLELYNIPSNWLHCAWKHSRKSYSSGGTHLVNIA